MIKIGKKTGLILLLWFGLSVVFLLLLEAATLSDNVPMNHITAVIHQAFYAQPGVFVWLSFSLGFLSGHLFWGTKD